MYLNGYLRIKLCSPYLDNALFSGVFIFEKIAMLMTQCIDSRRPKTAYLEKERVYTFRFNAGFWSKTFNREMFD